jgi:PAS domain S-box-containing protein
MTSNLIECFKIFASNVGLILNVQNVSMKACGKTFRFLSESEQLIETDQEQTGFETRFSQGKIILSEQLQGKNLIIFNRLIATFDSEIQARFLKFVLDHLDDAVVACDENGTLRFFNQKTKELHGLPEETIPADEWANHYDLYSPDLKTRMSKESIPLFRAFSGENVENAEMMIARKGQRPIYIHSNARPMYGKDGRKVGAFAIMREETQIKRQLNAVESRFNTIFMQSPLSIQILSREGKTLLVNPAWKKLWQIPDDVIENFILKDYNLLEDPTLEAQGVMNFIQRGFQGEVTRIPIIPYDVKGLGIEGSQRSVEGLIYPLKDAVGKVRELVLIHIDVTERERLVSELKQAVAQRDEFISIASHELKTPITSMKLQLHLLNNMITKDFMNQNTIKKVSEITTRQLNRITHLVEDMLDISRITSGKLAITPKESDVSQLLADVMSRFAIQLEDNQIDIHVTAPPHLLAVCDSFRIEQVLINLMTNAIRYGMGKPITIELKKVSDDVVVSVSDQGMGIDPKDIHRIFERFERATSADNVSGLGLGLFISRQIMELHKGTLTVESKPGQGSIFTARWKALN